MWIVAVSLYIRMRHLRDGAVQVGLECSNVEIAEKPNPKDMIQKIPPLSGHRVGFPNRHADGVRSPKGAFGPYRRNAVIKLEIGPNTSAKERFNQWIGNLPVVLRQV